MFGSAPTPDDPRSYDPASRAAKPLITPPPMNASLPETHVQPQLELRLDQYQTTGGSIGYGPNGTTLAFTFWPVSDEIVAALNDVAERRGTICLYCCREPLLFDPVTIELKGPNRMRITGRIVGSGISVRHSS